MGRSPSRPPSFPRTPKQTLDKKIHRLSLYLDADSRPRQHRHRNLARRRTPAPNRCNDYRRGNVWCRRRGIYSKVASTCSPCLRPHCPVLPVLLLTGIQRLALMERYFSQFLENVDPGWCARNLSFRVSAWFNVGCILRGQCCARC